MSDLIDRAEVMKLLDEQCWNGMFTYFRGEHHVNCFRELVKAIPSVENKGEPCDDCISRNDVIKMLNTMDRYTADKLKLCDTDKEFPHNEVFIVDDVYEEIIEQLPPADVRENIHGTWEEWKVGKYEGVPICSVCKHGFPLGFNQYNFCPNCGADMRGKANV